MLDCSKRQIVHVEDCSELLLETVSLIYLRTRRLNKLELVLLSLREILRVLAERIL